MTGLYSELWKPINVDENLQDFEQDNKKHAHLITEGKKLSRKFLSDFVCDTKAQAFYEQSHSGYFGWDKFCQKVERADEIIFQK